MTIRLFESNGYETTNQDRIGENDLVLDWAYFLQVTDWIAQKATAGAEIVWVNQTEETFASDNETVAQKRVNFVPADAGRKYEVEITWWTVTVADEGKYYDLTDADTVNWVSESATTGQVQLVKFVSATESIFQIANK